MGGGGARGGAPCCICNQPFPGFLTPAQAFTATSDRGLLLGLTLAVSMITYNSGKTNILLGAVHLVLFATYLMLIFDTIP